MSVNGLRLEREAVVARGVATFAGLPAGDFEVYAGGAGAAWASVTGQVGAAAEVVLGLDAGQPLSLVLSTPDGFPIEGVRAELFGLDADAIVVMDPRTRAHESDENGVLTIPDLPAQRYRVRLTAPGYRSLEVRGLTPGDTTHFASLVAHTSEAKRPK